MCIRHFVRQILERANPPLGIRRTNVHSSDEFLSVRIHHGSRHSRDFTVFTSTRLVIWWLVEWTTGGVVCLLCAWVCDCVSNEYQCHSSWNKHTPLSRSQCVNSLCPTATLLGASFWFWTLNRRLLFCEVLNLRRLRSAIGVWGKVMIASLNWSKLHLLKCLQIKLRVAHLLRSTGLHS